MKELLERWSQLEPNKCISYSVSKKFSVCGLIVGYQTENSLMKIQWAVQQTIIEKGWHFLLEYHEVAKYYLVRVNRGQEFKSYTSSSEALLEAYLKVLDA